MKKKIQMKDFKLLEPVLKFFLVFIGIVFVGIALLTIVGSIPREYVEENLEKAIDYFNINNTEIRKKEAGEYSFIHTYCEEMLLNIIYCLDTSKPLKSVMEAKYYERFENEGGNLKYIQLVKNDLKPNAEYMRYWHGSMIVIKPLLIFLTVEQIHVVTGVALAILLIALLAILIKKKHYGILIAFLIGMVMITFWYIPFTFEYVFVFFLMLIASIFSIYIEEKNSPNKNQKLYMLYWVIGILTCFFDFLTAEILTILVPVIIVLTIRMKKGEVKSFKKQFIFLIISLLLWGTGYCLMFVAKWVSASLILNINALDYVIDKALVRVNGRVLNYTEQELIWVSLKNNFTTLYGIYFLKESSVYLIAMIMILFVPLVVALDRKNKEKVYYLILMLIPAIVPYIRYIVLANHSVRHVFMTFRCQLATIMCYILVLIYTLNKDRLFPKLKKKVSKSNM